MDQATETLAQRIIKAAHLAAMMHLHAALPTEDERRRHVVIGGAGPAFAGTRPARHSKDGEPSLFAGGAE